MAKAKKSKSSKSTGKTDAEQRSVIKLARRDCKLAGNLSIRTEKHGDDNKQASDLVLSEIEISIEEANALLQDAHACRALFVKGARGKPDRPMLPQLDPLKIADAIESAHVSIYLGPNAGGELKLGTCRLKHLKITRAPGPNIKLSCMIQATPKLDARIGDLASRLNGTAQVSIEYEHNAEQLEADLGDDKSSKADEGSDFAAAAKQQVDAWNKGTRTPHPDPDATNESAELN